jgi:hypothetical protein
MSISPPICGPQREPKVDTALGITSADRRATTACPTPTRADYSRFMRRISTMIVCYYARRKRGIISVGSPVSAYVDVVNSQVLPTSAHAKFLRQRSGHIYKGNTSNCIVENPFQHVSRDNKVLREDATKHVQ